MEKDKKKIVSSEVSKFKLENVIQELQAFALGLRHEHWETLSYETHKNVEQAQGTIEYLTDKFVEAYIGMIGGKRPIFKKDLKANTDENAMIKCMENLNVKDSSILNIRDEILQALYQYKYLKGLK